MHATDDCVFGGGFWAAGVRVLWRRVACFLRRGFLCITSSAVTLFLHETAQATRLLFPSFSPRCRRVCPGRRSHPHRVQRKPIRREFSSRDQRKNLLFEMV